MKFLHSQSRAKRCIRLDVSSTENSEFPRLEPRPRMDHLVFFLMNGNTDGVHEIKRIKEDGYDREEWRNERGLIRELDPFGSQELARHLTLLLLVLMTIFCKDIA